MPGARSRNKGARGELEWRDQLRLFGCTGCERGRQRHGGPDSPDVRHGIPGTHAEVKRYARISHCRWFNQAAADAAPDDIPYLATREDHGEWLMTFRARDLPALVERFAEIEGKPIYPRLPGSGADK